MKMKEIQSCIYRILEILELVGEKRKGGGQGRIGKNREERNRDSVETDRSFGTDIMCDDNMEMGIT